MNYVTIRQQALGILNRSDATDTLMQTWVQQAIQRCQRELRLPHMERLLQIDTSSAAVSQLLVPPDWLETIAFTSEDANGINYEIGFTDFGSFQKLSNDTFGQPTYYCRRFDRFLIADPINQGAVAYFYYYGEEGQLVADTDASTLSQIAPDLLIYGALTYAADFFIDDRGQTWEQKWQFAREQLQSQASEGENETGDGAIMPFATYSDYVW